MYCLSRSLNPLQDGAGYSQLRISQQSRWHQTRARSVCERLDTEKPRWAGLFMWVGAAIL
jgi:hypothetical protein